MTKSKWKVRLIDGMDMIEVEAEEARILEAQSWVRFYTGKKLVASFARERVISIIKES